MLLLLSRHITRMKSSSCQFIFVIIHVVTSSHYFCLISASCAMPDPIPNIITTLPNQTLDTGSYITWECSDGYMMDGLTNTVVWVCLEDGSWLGHTPICTAIECPSPPIAAYSELDPPLHEAPVVNQTISYTCSSEYTLIGSSLNKCLQDGTWENDPPVCQRDCDDTADHIKRYSDLTCYRRRGNSTPREWGQSLELCGKYEELLATVKDAETQTFLVEFIGQAIGTNVWIGAREGRDWMWRRTDTYIERFFWPNPFPDSNPGDCVELSYHSGSAKYSWNPKSCQDENALLCQYDQSCQSVGLNQSSRVLEYMSTCFQFLNVSMTCADGARECERMEGFLAEIIDESTNALLVDRALYLRNNNFAGEDKTWWIGGYDDDIGERSWYWSDQTRMIFDAWSPLQPSNQDDGCVQMTSQFFFQYEWNDRTCSEQKVALCQIGIPACGDPGEPLHANRLPDDRTTYSVDATLHFNCQEGYTLSGESVLRCMNNGAWNHQRPSCEAVECDGSPPEVALASTMILGSAYQDIALYTCQDGYIPDNEPISFCQHSGIWSTPNFACNALSPCYSNPCVNGGTCTVNGSSFTCTCPSSYTGPTCDVEFSPCNSNPCMNGGTCLDEDESSFSCTCTPGYIGPTCNNDIRLTTPFTFTTQASTQSTGSQTEMSLTTTAYLSTSLLTSLALTTWFSPKSTESPKGNSLPSGVVAAGSLVVILFILVVIVLTIVLFRRRRAAKPLSPDDENEMENYATVANCYEGSKPADSSPPDPYYLTLEQDSDQNGRFGTSIAEQPSPHLWKGVTQDDTPSVMKGSNGWNETDTEDGFVDNVLYGTSEEQIPPPGNHKSGAPETDEDAYEGYEDEEIMVDNELYGAPSPITPRCHKHRTVADQENDAVYENPDRNVYETYEEDDSMVDNELYGAAIPPTPRADNMNDPVFGEGDSEMYQNTEFHSVPTNLIANEFYKSVDEI